MTDTLETPGSNGHESEIRSAIEAFEQVLAVVPDDVPSLRAILNAYEDLGDPPRSCVYVQRLGAALLGEGDIRGMEELLPLAEKYCSQGFDELAELVARMETAVKGSDASAATGAAAAAVAADRSDSDAAPAPGPDVSSHFEIEPELALAWSLLEFGDLTQDEYASVVQDLTEMSVGDVADTVSVLHVLEARGFRKLEQVIGRMAEECGAPVVSLACFDIQTDQYLLPMDFMLRRGALVFEHVADHVLVAVLNPHDEKLRRDVQAIIGRECHFFTTVPSEFDEALNRISDVEAQAGAAATSE